MTKRKTFVIVLSLVTLLIASNSLVFADTSGVSYTDDNEDGLIQPLAYVTDYYCSCVPTGGGADECCKHEVRYTPQGKFLSDNILYCKWGHC